MADRVKPGQRVMWQERCQRWQRDNDFQLEVDWSTSVWWRPTWWTIEERYFKTILGRLDRQLKNQHNQDPLRVYWKYIWYECTADEHIEEFIMDFEAMTNWDLKTECVRQVRVIREVVKNTKRYQ